MLANLRLSEFVAATHLQLVSNFCDPADRRGRRILEIGSANGVVTDMVRRELDKRTPFTDAKISVIGTDPLDHGNADVERLSAENAVSKYGRDAFSLLIVHPLPERRERHGSGPLSL